MCAVKKSEAKWLDTALKRVEGRHDGASLSATARKLADCKALTPLWRTLQAEFTGDEFWTSSESFFSHLVLNVTINLKPPVGYRAMTPAQLAAWRKRTQKHALALLSDLMDGYPEIVEREDATVLGDRWIYDAAVNIASKGRADSLAQLIETIEQEKDFSKNFGSAMASVSRTPLILRHLIEWLDYEVARGHSVTQLASNTHRNSFIRRMTAFFELHLGSPMRSHVFNIASLFFDMEGLTQNDIKKIAPANAEGRLSVKFAKDLPG